MTHSIKGWTKIKINKWCRISVIILTSIKTIHDRVYAVAYCKLEMCNPSSICFTFPTNVSPTSWRVGIISDKNSISLSTHKYMQIATGRGKYAAILFWLRHLAGQSRSQARIITNSKRSSHEWVQLYCFQLRRPGRLCYCFLFLSKSYRTSHILQSNLVMM